MFQAQLGTVFEKAQARLRPGRSHRRTYGGNAQNRARRHPSKCDLATEMVGEFPEMQGIAGYYYATHGGEAEDVALAPQRAEYAAWRRRRATLDPDRRCRGGGR